MPRCLETVPAWLPREGEMMDNTSERMSLSERIAQANAIRDQAAMAQPERELIDAERRSAFDSCYIYRAHADELLRIVGQIAEALPSSAAFSRERTRTRLRAPRTNRLRLIPRWKTRRSPLCGR